MDSRWICEQRIGAIQNLSHQVKSMRWKLVLLLVLVPALPVCSQVRVWEGVLDLPVYEEGAPDPNPPFDPFAVNRFSIH
jgi:hypothetical protein